MTNGPAGGQASGRFWLAGELWQLGAVQCATPRCT